METKQRKPDKFTRKAIILAIYVPILGIMIHLCSHSSQVIEPHYHAMRVHSHPTKQVYVVGCDTALDLTGGELCYAMSRDLPLADNGTCGKKGCYFDIPMEEALRIDDDDMLSVYTNVDFTKPGIYEVRFCSVVQNGKWEEVLSCSFPIVVIDPKDAVK